MIDPRRLFVFQNKHREYDDNNGLILELNNYTYKFLHKPRTIYFWDTFGNNVWVSLVQQPIQKKEQVRQDFFFETLADVINNKDIPHLYSFIEILYNTLHNAEHGMVIGDTNLFEGISQEFESNINLILTRFNTGLLMCTGYIIRGIDASVQKQIEDAVDVGDQASRHIKNAVEMLSTKAPKDTHICISEAVLAPEIIIKEATGARSLTESIAQLRKEGQQTGGHVIPQSLLASLEKFYAYTSDSSRHASSKSKPIEEAQLVIGLSAVWTNYLRKKLIDRKGANK